MALTIKQQRFADEYIKSLNATRSAIAAGYSEDSAYSIGSENLRKPEVRAYIDEKLKEAAISADEAVKLLGDIAKGCLNNYYKVKRVEYTPKVEVSLKEFIRIKEQEIAFEDEYASLAALSGEHLEAHEVRQASRRDEVLRLNLELKYNPKATRIINGATTLIDRAELDLVALVNDKEGGRIKSLTYTEFGPKVELYAADAALRDIAKMHGLFEKDNQQRSGDITVNIT